MSLVDALLQADVADLLKQETTELEIKRLSGELKEPFILKLGAIPTKKLIEMQELSIDIDKKGKSNVNVVKLQTQLMSVGVLNTDFNDEKVLKAYGCATKVDLLYKLLHPVEIGEVVTKINEISGNISNDEAIDEIKN